MRRLWADEMAPHKAIQKAADRWKICYYFEDGELLRSAVRPLASSLWPGKVS